MTKSVVTRMSFRLDKDVETYLLKSRSDDNEKMSCYRQFIRGLTFKKKIIYTVQVHSFFIVRKSSSVTLEFTSIYFIYFLNFINNYII
jgi:hypothetical protein